MSDAADSVLVFNEPTLRLATYGIISVEGPSSEKDIVVSFPSCH